MKPDWNRLNVTMIGCRKHSSRHAPRGEFTALFAVEDPETGEKGHFAYEYEWEKRDVMYLAVRTDNPALVVLDDAGPDCFDWGDPHQDDTGPDPNKHEAWDACQIDAWSQD